MATARRAYWKGYLKLSLVTCPIALYPASSQAEKTHLVPPINLLPLPLLTITMIYMAVFALMVSRLLKTGVIASGIAVVLGASVYYGSVYGLFFGLGFFSAMGSECHAHARRKLRTI
jgi:hypothetical protein